MKKSFLFLCAFFFILGFSFGQGKVSSTLNTTAQSVQPNEKIQILVTLNEQYDMAGFQRNTRFLSNNLCTNLAIEELRRFSESSQQGLMQLLQEYGEQVSDIRGLWLFNGISCKATKEVVYALADRPEVAVVDLVTESETGSFSAQEVEVDRNAKGQWGISFLHADQVWNDFQITGSNVLVAIIDSGVNYDHVGLSGNMWNGGTAYPNHGYNFYNGTKNPKDDFGRGTMVAGLIAGHASFATGIAPGASIMALKVVNKSGNGANVVSTAEAAQFAITNHAKIVVITACEPATAQSVEYLQVMCNLNGARIVAITSAGDAGQTATAPNSINSPSNCPSPWHNPDESLDGLRSANICVGATDENDMKTPFSSYGPVTWANYNDTVNAYPYTPNSTVAVGHIRPDVTAPGVNITSLNHLENNSYAMPSQGSTVYSAAQVAGVAALLLQANPNLSPEDIDRILETTAVKCDGMMQKNNYYGAGRVDAWEAVNFLLSTVAAPTNLTVQANYHHITLHWTASADALSYDIYCNEELLVAGAHGTSYSYVTPESGTHIYYLKANGDNNTQSPKSNYASVFVNPDGPVVSNLQPQVAGHQVTLTWSAPEIPDELRYGNAETAGSGLGYYAAETYWAQRFRPSTLVNYLGSKMDVVSMYIYTPGTYKLSIYRGNANGPDVALCAPMEFSVGSSQVPGWHDITLATPLSLPVDTDVWFVAWAGASVSNPATWCNITQNPCQFGSLMSGDGKNWYNYSSNIAWMIKAHLVGGGYSYNVWRENNETNNNVKIASDLSALTYVDSNVPDGSYSYTITTNYNNHQSVSNPCNPAVVNINMKFTVTFDAGSGTCSTSQITQSQPGAAITLPVATPSTQCQNAGYTFAGWSPVVVEGETEVPASMISGNTYVPEESLTLYAVYKNVQNSGWNQARVINDGDEVCIVCNESHTEFNGVITIPYIGTVGEGKSFTSAPVGRYPFTVTSYSDGIYKLKDQNGKYLRKTNVSGFLGLGSVYSEGSDWTIEMINGDAVLRNASHSSNHQLVAKDTLDGTNIRKIFIGVNYPDQLNAYSKDIQLYRKAGNSFVSYDHEPACGNTLFPPTIQPVGEGLFLDPVTVTMTTTASNAQIYYTLDGSTPNTNSLLYDASNPPVVTSATTVKAKVFKNNSSSAMAQQSYAFPAEYPNIAAFKAAANQNQTFKITSSIRVTQQEGHYLYVSDATAGLRLYDGYGLLSDTYVDGDFVMPIQGRYKTIDGHPMMVLWHSVDKTGENSPVDGTPVTIQQANTNFNPYESQLVKFESVHFVEPLGSFDDTLIISQTDATIPVVNRFHGVDCTVDAEYTYDVLGILGIEGGTKYVYPRSNRDIRRYFTITCESVGSGTVSVASNDASQYSTITVISAPVSGYHLESLYYYGSNPEVMTEIDLATLQFEMPGEDIHIVGTFANDVVFSVTLNPGTGNCEVTSLTESAWNAGVVLPIATPSAACAAEGYTFVGWSERFVSETMITPTLFEAGSVYYPTHDTTLYAVYASGSSDWLTITDATQLVEGNYVITSKSGNNFYYLPHEGALTTPNAVKFNIINDVPEVTDQLWAVTRISDGANPQYSITYTEGDVTYYLKAKKDANNAIQVTTYDPGIGWVFSNDPNKGLMACFPNPVEDPTKTTRYLGLYVQGLFTSKWYFEPLSMYNGMLHLYLTPSSTYSTDPSCIAPMEDPWFVGLPVGIITADSYPVTIEHPDPTASIYYTVDGTEPTSASTLYTGTFDVNDDCTVKAVAIDALGRVSTVISHFFDFALRYDNIAAFKADNLPSTEVVWIRSAVTAVYQNDPYLYVCDNTASLMVKDNNSVITSTYANGMTILGGLAGTMANKNGQKMLVPTKDPGEATPNSEVMPLETEAIDLMLYDAVLVNVIDAEIIQEFISGNGLVYYQLSQGGNYFYVYDLFESLTFAGEVGMRYDITGFVGTNTTVSSNKLLYPRNDADLVPYYTITCDSVEGGEVISSTNHARLGDVVTLSSIPQHGYHLGYYTVTDCNEQTIEVAEDYSFVMPGCGVTVSAQFDLNDYEVVWSVYPTEDAGRVEIEEEGPYHLGDTLHVSAIASAGYVFGGWIVNLEDTGISDADTSFVVTGNMSFMAVFNPSPDIQQDVTINAGWNWFSSYIEYGDDALDQVQENIAEFSTTGTIKSRTSFNSLGNGVWTGTLTNLANEEMYMVFAESGTVTMIGALVDPAEHPITISNGWSWISFLSKDPIELNAALASLTPSENDVIKSKEYFSSYNAEMGWIGVLNNLAPGEGYMYQRNGEEPDTLVYPAAGKLAVEGCQVPLHWNANHHRFPTNLSMMVSLDAEAVAMGAGSHEIGAFVNGECRGSALLQKVGDHFVAFLSVSGEQGEEVSFRLFDVNNHEDMGVADEHIHYAADAVYGTVKSPMTLHFRNTGLNEFGEVNLFPNPTKDKVTVSGQGIQLVKVYNAMGQLLYSEALGQTERVELSLGSFSAGIYTLNILMSNGQQINRLIVKE